MFVIYLSCRQPMQKNNVFLVGGNMFFTCRPTKKCAGYWTSASGLIRKVALRSSSSHVH